MKILYFGAYDPSYARNRVLIKGLKKNGFEVVEVQVSPKSKFKYFNLLKKYLNTKEDFDILFVAFPGQEIIFLAKLLTEKPIVFDAFTSHYEGYVLDRKYFSKNSWRALYYKFLDKWSCQLADMVLLDTEAHIKFFVKQFSLSRQLFIKIFVGTDPDLFYPTQNLESKDKFTIHFHGNYIPLQGVEYIVETAKLLENENVTFNLIGRGQTYKHCYELAMRLGLNNINFIDKVPYEDLNKYINSADICLGIFGDTSKTQTVIPNKVFEALASGKAIITSETTAIKELLTDHKNVIFSQLANPIDLANKILELKNSKELRDQIGLEGLNIFSSTATPEILGKQLTNYIHERF